MGKMVTGKTVEGREQVESQPEVIKAQDNEECQGGKETVVQSGDWSSQKPWTLPKGSGWGIRIPNVHRERWRWRSASCETKETEEQRRNVLEGITKFILQRTKNLVGSWTSFS